jgi:hypothetical protein
MPTYANELPLSRQHTSAYVSIRLVCRYPVSIRQHTSAYVSIRLACRRMLTSCRSLSHCPSRCYCRFPTCFYYRCFTRGVYYHCFTTGVYMLRQQQPRSRLLLTPAYVSIRQLYNRCRCTPGAPAATSEEAAALLQVVTSAVLLQV